MNETTKSPWYTVQKSPKDGSAIIVVMGERHLEMKPLRGKAGPVTLSLANIGQSNTYTLRNDGPSKCSIVVRLINGKEIKHELNGNDYLHQNIDRMAYPEDLNVTCHES